MIENINFIEGSTLSGTFTIKSIIPGKMINGYYDRMQAKADLVQP